MKGLKGLSSRPKHSSKRINDEDIIKINDCVQNAKKKKKYITVNNVRRSTKIMNHSDTTINRYINKACNGKKNKKHIKESSNVSWKNKIDHLCIGR